MRCALRGLGKRREDVKVPCVTCYCRDVLMRDFVISVWTHKDRNLKFTMLFTMLICGRKSPNGDQAQSGRYTELQDASKKRKRWVHFKFLSQNYDVAHLELGHISDTEKCRSDLLISEAKKAP